MDRAHRLGQTKEVTVYRLICKETVEEKILQRASQKNTVQQLVMTGRQAQSDMLAPDDVVSLLLDDAQLEQKIKEHVPIQSKDKQRKKAIRLDAEGDACLEDITLGAEKDGEPENGKLGSKKRKRNADRKEPSKPRNMQKSVKYSETSEQKDPKQLIIDGDSKQKGKSGKRTKKSSNDSSHPGDPVEQAVELTESSLANMGTIDAKAEMDEDDSSQSYSSSR